MCNATTIKIKKAIIVGIIAIVPFIYAGMVQAEDASVPTQAVISQLGLSEANSIGLQYESVPTATGYKIVRNGSVVKDIVGSAGSVYEDNNLSYDTDYTYGVIAYNANGDGPLSQTYTVRTLKDNRTLTIVASSTQNILSWSNVNTNPVMNFMIYRDDTQIYNANGATAMISYNDTGATCQSQHTYYVKYAYSVTPAVGGAFITAMSKSNVATCPVSTQVVISQLGLSEANSIGLQYESVPTATGYKIVRNGSVVKDIVGSAGSVYEDNNLSYDTDYTYGVIAYNANGDGSLSQTYTVHTLKGNTTLVASPKSSTQIDLSWSNPNTEGVLNLIIYRDGTSTQIYNANGSSTMTSYSDTTLACGGTHSYTIKYFYSVTPVVGGAFSAAGDFSNTASATVSCPSSGGGGGGGGAGYSSSPIVVKQPTSTILFPNTTSTKLGKVLGSSTFNFTYDFGIGTRGDVVTELQKRLVTEGLLDEGSVTGYFGTLTQAAVKKYQEKYGIYASGFVGQLTRARLNTSGSGSLEERIAQLKMQIELLKKQILEIIQKNKDLEKQVQTL